MKRHALAAILAAATFAGLASAAHAADVGVSVRISEPGVFGRIDIGRFPQPQLVVQQPVIIGRPVRAQVDPIYLWVPPGHRQNWRRHCAEYGACGVPVYFVQDRWYGEHVRPYAPGGRLYGRADDRRDFRHEERREERHEERRDDRRDDRHDGGGDRGRGEHRRD
jgi:hypothetical protein